MAMSSIDRRSFMIGSSVAAALGSVGLSQNAFGMAAAPGATCSEPSLTAQPVYDFDYVSDDKGTGAHGDLTIFRARPPKGFVLLGDTAVSGYSQPTTAAMVVRENCSIDGNPILAPAIGSQMRWGWHGSHPLGFSTLVPPANYVAIGAIAAQSDFHNYYCVRSDYVKALGGMYRLWDDQGTGSGQDAGQWSDVSVFVTADFPGIFQIQQGYDGWTGPAYRPITA